MSLEYDDYASDGPEDCPQCGGEGGYPMCPEDCCPNFYGEENCTEPACWNRCSVCRGRGYVGGEP